MGHPIVRPGRFIFKYLRGIPLIKNENKKEFPQMRGEKRPAREQRQGFFAARGKWRNEWKIIKKHPGRARPERPRRQPPAYPTRARTLRLRRRAGSFPDGAVPAAAPKLARRPYHPRRRRPAAASAGTPAVPVKIMPLGGLGEVGKNITLYECQGDMILVDCGIVFPDSDMFGVDLVSGFHLCCPE